MGPSKFYYIKKEIEWNRDISKYCKTTIQFKEILTYNASYKKNKAKKNPSKRYESFINTE
jgi:hypothetical protein